MAKFSELPNEILLMILDHLPIMDAVTFSKLSRNTRAVAASFRKTHTWLRRRYTHRKYSSKKNTNLHGTLADLLRDVLQYPELGHYVRTLQIDGYEDFDADYVENKETMELFRHAIHDCTLIEGQLEKQSWLEYLSEGDEEPVIALLLLMLPNLTNLRLKDFGNSYCIGYMAIRISAKKDTTALARLSAIEVEDREGNTTPESGDLVQSLSSLPSIKRLSVSNAGNDFRLGNHPIFAQINDRGSNSQVTHMSFTNCALHPTVLSSIMTSSQNLTSFNYCSNRRAKSFGKSDYKWIRDALLVEAKDTLKDLRLYSYNEDFMGGLKDFTVLQNVSTSSGLLFGLDRKKKHSLAQMLPATIKSLTLHDYGDLGLIYHLEILEDLAKTKANTLHELHFLQYFFSTEDRVTRGAKKAFKEQVGFACKGANIRCDVDWVSDCPRDRETEVAEASGWSRHLR